MRTIALVGLCALVGCGGAADSATFQFAGTVTACETLEWARTRADLLEGGDPGEADRFGQGRCFRVEVARPVRIVETSGGLIRRSRRWALVTTVDGEPLEHHASAELRRVTGRESPVQGWVHWNDLMAGAR